LVVKWMNPCASRVSHRPLSSVMMAAPALKASSSSALP
jgi:hypothetical protein